MKVAPRVVACLLLAVSLAGCASNQADDGVDTDRDGLMDGQERAGWDVLVTALDGSTSSRHVTSDPLVFATDGTALDDHYKYALGLDPRLQDTDGDGLTDCQEVFDRSAARCAQPKAALANDGGSRTLADRSDTDSDGVSDGREVNGWILQSAVGARLVTSNPLSTDSDLDGLADGAEQDLGVDPGAMDSDGDGCRDGIDVDPARDAWAGPGLVNFTLNTAAESKIRITVLMGGHTGVLEFEAKPGMPVELAKQSPAAQRPLCAFNPVTGLLDVQVIVHELGSTGARALDIGAGPLIGSFRPRDASIFAANGGLAGMLHASGPDGALELRPLLLENQGA